MRKEMRWKDRYWLGVESWGKEGGPAQQICESRARGGQQRERSHLPFTHLHPHYWLLSSQQTCYHHLQGHLLRKTWALGRRGVCDKGRARALGLRRRWGNSAHELPTVQKGKEHF